MMLESSFFFTKKKQKPQKQQENVFYKTIDNLTLYERYYIEYSIIVVNVVISQ